MVDMNEQTMQALRALELVRRTSAALKKNPPDIRSALADYQATAAADADNVELLRCYGVFLAGLGDRMNAAQTFERALMIDPQSEVVLLEYAKILSYGLSPNDEDGNHEEEYIRELQRAYDLVQSLLQVNPHNDEGQALKASIQAALTEYGRPPSAASKAMTISQFETPAATATAKPPVPAGKIEEGDDSDDEALQDMGKRLQLGAKPKRRYKFFCMPIPML